MEETPGAPHWWKDTYATLADPILGFIKPLDLITYGIAFILMSPVSIGLGLVSGFFLEWGINAQFEAGIWGEANGKGPLYYVCDLPVVNLLGDMCPF